MKRPHMDEAAWINVKKLLEGNVKKSLISEVTGKAWSTLVRIEKSNSFQDYQMIVKADNDALQAKRAAKMQLSDTIPAAPTQETPDEQPAEDLKPELSGEEMKILNANVIALTEAIVTLNDSLIKGTHVKTNGNSRIPFLTRRQ